MDSQGNVATSSFNGTSTTQVMDSTVGDIFTTVFETSSFKCQNCVTTFDPLTESKLLSVLSQEMAILFFPVIVFVAALMILGTIGNMIVIYIYCFRYKSRSTNSNYYIIAMAVFDFIASAVAMPINIYDLVQHYTFYDVIGCKLFRYTENFATFGSAIVLIEIAFDRYLKICRPLTLSTERKTKILCWLAGVIAVILSIPALILFGITRSRTGIAGLRGYDCSVADAYRTGNFRNIFYALLFLLFIVTFALLAGLYIRIWVEIRTRKGSTVGDRIGSSSQPPDNTASGRKDNGRGPLRQLSSLSDSDDGSSVFTSKKTYNRTASQTSKKPRLSSISEAVRNIRVSRTTKIFIAVTVAYVLSYLPTIIVQVCLTVIKRLQRDQSQAERVLLKLFARSHYINNAINPVIYSFLNVNFRNHCRKLFSDIVSCRPRLLKVKKRPSFSESFRKMKSSRTDRSDSTHKSDHTKELEMEHLHSQHENSINATQPLKQVSFGSSDSG